MSTDSSKAVDAVTGVAGVAAAGPWDKVAALFGSSPVSTLIIGGLLAGETELNASVGTGSALLNTSGQVVGKGSAQGGDMSTSLAAPSSWPWYVWPVGALLCMAIIKKAG